MHTYLNGFWTISFQAWGKEHKSRRQLRGCAQNLKCSRSLREVKEEYVSIIGRGGGIWASAGEMEREKDRNENKGLDSGK